MSTTNPTDPNQIRLTGENSFIRLVQEEGGDETTRVSHWRILYSPSGAGHVLFLKSDLTDDEVRIYSDNIAMTRWLQGEIESIRQWLIRVISARDMSRREWRAYFLAEENEDT